MTVVVKFVREQMKKSYVQTFQNGDQVDHSLFYSMVDEAIGIKKKAMSQSASSGDAMQG